MSAFSVEHAIPAGKLQERPTKKRGPKQNQSNSIVGREEASECAFQGEGATMQDLGTLM